MPDMFEHEAALSKLLTKPAVVARCESCSRPLNAQTGECSGCSD